MQKLNTFYMIYFSLSLMACQTDEDEALWRESKALLSGVVISVDIDKPLDQSTHPSGPVLVAGTATLGETKPVARTTLAYVIDVSGSTRSGANCGGNINDDLLSDSVLDCEIASVLALNKTADIIGTIKNVGLAVFGSKGSPADVQPGGTDNDLLTAIDANLDQDAEIDLEEVAKSIKVGSVKEFTQRFVGEGTSYGAGLAAVKQVLLASPKDHNKIVVFLSDGGNGEGPHINDVLPMPDGTVIHTFAVGDNKGLACDTNSTYGSLQDIADATGGTCTHVSDVANLPDVLPSIITAQLIGLKLTVDGMPASIDNMSQMLPQPGAVAVTWSTTLDGLAPGAHELCATAEGSDAMGGGDVEECVTIFINSPPVALCKDVSVAADAYCEAQTASIDDGSYDPDGDAFKCHIDPPGPYSLGETKATLTCKDSHGAVSSCEATIEVVDETPPTIELIKGPYILWPPNHQYFDHAAGDCVDKVTDNCEDDEDELLGSLELVRVTSDESDLAKGSGNTCLDIELTGESTCSVRAERIGGDDGRVYTAYVEATDKADNAAYGSCQLVVPANGNPNEKVVDSGCALCVGDGCGDCPGNSAKCK